jgi:hypothetical protein
MFLKISLALILSIGALEFYWYGYRPKQIRASCDAQAMAAASAIYRDRANYDVQAAYSPGAYHAEDKERVYTTCLRDHGLYMNGTE